MSKKKYVVDKKKKKKDSVKVITIEGYNLSNKKNKFYIKGESVSNIVVTNEELVKRLINYKVDKKYKQLIDEATSLLIDDDNDDNTTLILDHVEKFRQEIKNKYKKYLEAEKLRLMAKQLTVIKKEVAAKEIAIRESYLESKKENKAK